MRHDTRVPFGGFGLVGLRKPSAVTILSRMDTIARIHLADIAIPAEVSLHARIVIEQWLQHARTAAEKSDLYETHRLIGLVRAKIGDELSRTRSCCEG